MMDDTNPVLDASSVPPPSPDYMQQPAPRVPLGGEPVVRAALQACPTCGGVGRLSALVGSRRCPTCHWLRIFLDDLEALRGEG